MILNVVDRRKNTYRWKSIDVIVEPTWHDNAFADGDQAPHDYSELGYAARKGVSLAEAVTWALSFTVPLTLYLYDEGCGAVDDGCAPNSETAD
ncbi:hypothetical protein [Muricoccus aerilatus]|uniref:hypothetical protein n=1 Tax=Muricoccus aerilatus TaxID=452982 RepID=UPI0005C20AC1|nr:hypothetical protein [Roseomonas aerilata]